MNANAAIRAVGAERAAVRRSAESAVLALTVVMMLAGVSAYLCQAGRIERRWWCGWRTVLCTVHTRVACGQ